MMTTSERFMIEEFDHRYQNRCQLKLALLGYPEFEELKAVAEFTAEEKVKYIRIIRFVEQFVKASKAAKEGLIPALDPFDTDLDIPDYINRNYLATIVGIL